ncbi:sugar phosphate isomerase/epimerase [Melghirimyces profundicolus]|uniref:Sugar phosphate isomerase/epimerase n=1 Tax=Melghirimyces profundicolus TaxID=1242148 RepID=A0A2T6BW58_9BACL|nr:sugar phosphate isomerase/epimerase [Melghirimyces profundicolus]PTX60305.1 sugar phosphate isomerase/epimerase [Melghirimyces profundicolus]
MVRIGLQLYSVKEAAQADLLGTVEKVAEMGYDGVEFAGFFGHGAREIRRVLEDTGLKTAGSHLPLDQLLPDRLEKTMDFHEELGCPLLVCPWLPEELRSPEGFREVAGILDRAGEICAKRGLELAYHNHDFEFDPPEGPNGFGILFDHTTRVKMELDCYWAVDAGLDPGDLIRKDSGRYAALHIKDLKRTSDGNISTEIGDGEIDNGTLVELAEKEGIPWVIAEQEHFRGDPMESAAVNARVLKALVRGAECP